MLSAQRLALAQHPAEGPRKGGGGAASVARTGARCVSHPADLARLVFEPFYAFLNISKDVFDFCKIAFTHKIRKLR